MNTPFPKVYGAAEGRLRMVSLDDLKARRRSLDAAVARHRRKPFEHTPGSLLVLALVTSMAAAARRDEIEAFYATIEPWGA